MKKHFLLILLILSSCFSFAQNKTIDSLQKTLATAKEDSNKVKALLAMCAKDGMINDSARFVYAENALQLSQKINYRKGSVMALVSLGACSNNLGNFDKALKYLNE